jgi:hypothetical protein
MLLKNYAVSTPTANHIDTRLRTERYVSHSHSVPVSQLAHTNAFSEPIKEAAMVGAIGPRALWSPLAKHPLVPRVLIVYILSETVRVSFVRLASFNKSE